MSGRTDRSNRRPVVVIDIDGVIADVRHRLRHVEGRPKNWDAFFAAAPQDPPLAAGIDRARLLAQDHDLVFLTGRPERCRIDTQRWLGQHNVPPGELIMRRAGDRRPARVTKLEELERLRSEHDVRVVLDDDVGVVDAVRDAGFAVEHVTWMHEDQRQRSTLSDVQERHGRT